MKKRPVSAVFNQGGTPTIACFVAPGTVTPLDASLAAYIAALQKYVTSYVKPVWGTTAKLVKSTGFLPGAWAIVFVDDADVAGALAYHDLTPDGLPVSYVFLRTTVQAGERISVSASHELVEMLVDPAVNMMCTGPDAAATYAYESADPVEATDFTVLGLPMSNFIYPSYFEAFRKPGSVKFDYLGLVAKPFQLLKGGYQIVFKNGRWTQVFGSKAAERQFRQEDRRMHRSEQRKT